MSKIQDLEDDWSITIPADHVSLMLRPYDDPEVMKLGLLLAESEVELLDVSRVNERLHDLDYAAPWPEEAFAFATNECGDYFAYYSMGDVQVIIYVNPFESPEAAIRNEDALIYSTFEEWRSSKLDP